MYTRVRRPYGGAGKCRGGWWLVLAVLMSVSGWGAQADAAGLKEQRRRCTKQFRRSLFLKASACFLSLYQKNKKSGDLLNLAQSYRLAAENQRSSFYEVQLRKKAIRYFLLFKKKKPSEGFWTEQMLRKLRASIRKAQAEGHGFVWLKAPGEAVRYTFSYDGRQVGAGALPFREDLRPGRYTFVLRREGYHPQTLILKVHKDKMLVLRPQMRKESEGKPAPLTFEGKGDAPVLSPAGGQPNKQAGAAPGAPGPLPWVLLGGSVLLNVVGGIFVAVAASRHGDIKASQDAKASSQAFDEMGWLLPAGAVMVFVGIAGQVGAGVLFYLSTSKAESPPVKPS